MKIASTTTLVKCIKEELKERGYKGAKINYTKIDRDDYIREFGTDYFCENYDYDYDYATGKMRLIVVSYDPEMYACENYITTSDLKKMVNKMRNRGEQVEYKNYIENVVEEFVEI